MKVSSPFVTPSTGQNLLYSERLAKGLQGVKEQRLKVYHTYVTVGNRQECFVFTTTSKDIHLELGRLDKLVQDALAMFLKYELGNTEDQVLLSLEETDQRNGSGILVTMTKTSTGSINFTLAPAH